MLLLAAAAQIIQYLTKAYECHKREKSTRLMLHVASAMAQEYWSSANYDMAKKYCNIDCINSALALCGLMWPDVGMAWSLCRFYDRIAKTYRADQWWAILTPILTNAYDCARKVHSLHTARPLQRLSIASHYACAMSCAVLCCAVLCCGGVSSWR